MTNTWNAEDEEERYFMNSTWNAEDEEERYFMTKHRMQKMKQRDISRQTQKMKKRDIS